MLAEFKYGGVPKETFAPFLGSQDKPSSLFYWMKKDLFPLAYWNAFVKVSSAGRLAYKTCEANELSNLPQGIWFGPRGLLRPTTY